MKGLFIPDITAEMFRNGCLEGIETLMAEGEIYDIDYSLEQEPILDKIRAEIESCREDEVPHLCDYRYYRNEGLDIDKYKAES